MNDYIFMGGVYPSCKKQEIIKICGSIPQTPEETLQRNILKGLNENTKANITLFNTYFLPPMRKIARITAYSWHDYGGMNYNIPFIYLKMYQHFSKYLNLKKIIYKWFKNEKDMSRKYLIIYSAYFPFIMCAFHLKKRYNIDVCLIVPDLPEYMGLDSNNGIYRRLSKRLIRKLIDRRIGCVDSFVFLTKQMSNVMNKGNKPYIVMEGIATNDYVFEQNIPNTITKRVLYSGTLQFKYGIGVLLEAIKLITYPDVEFVFYGSGEGKVAVITEAENDPRIIYHEPISRKELYLEQQKSTLLINPRQNKNAFTKYSFPSKLIEYMLSGRPIIAYKLDGIQDEYDKFINYPIDNSPEALGKLIEIMLRMPEEYLTQQCEDARQFVMVKKNYLVQTKRILSLLGNTKKIP